MRLHFIFMAGTRPELAARAAESRYAESMARFLGSWASEAFSADLDVEYDEMVTGRRGLFGRLDTHAVVRDHRERGESDYHFYLCNFRPTWTDCTCEGYHAPNLGMILWQRPGESAGDGRLFMAEKNCTAASHELAHELLRQAGHARYVPDVHDVWTRHFHDGLAFEQYGEDFCRTAGRPAFLTIDASQFRGRTRRGGAGAAGG